MGKLSVVLYISIGIALLFFLSRSPNNHPNRPHDTQHYAGKGGSIRRHGHGHRRLKVKSNFTFTPQDHLDHHPDPNHPDFRHAHHRDPVPFDPVITEIERHREDKVWERMYFDEHHMDGVAILDHGHREGHGHEHGHDGTYRGKGATQGHDQEPEWEDFMDAEDYLNDEERFNVTNRLGVLFPKIDVDIDGFVSKGELIDWHLQQTEKEVLHRTRREMDLHDKNKDGNVSFSEYDPPSWVKSADNNSFGYDMGWWKEEHFNASDFNDDSLLNITEFNDFLHPADTKNPKLLKWLCKEEIRERDSDKDGNVNFNEFFYGIFYLVRNYDEEGHKHNSSRLLDDSDTPAAKKVFSQFDKDDDGFLSETELLTIIGKLHPPEQYYAKQQANYILSQADTNKDGRLSLAEMIENPFVFYSSVFSERKKNTTTMKSCAESLLGL